MALVSAITHKFTNGNGKNHVGLDSDLLILADPILMKVVKREGNIVPYDKEKIQRAVGMCFESVGERIGEITPQIVTDQVDTILRLKSCQLSEDGHLAEVGIEAIQDIVEAQLMALGQFEAAKHYILYRDERRRVREESRGISPEMKNFFKEGCVTFTGTNRLLQEVQAFDKFSRFRRDFTPKRRETWPESCQRVMDYYRGHITKIAPGSVPAETWAILHDGLLHHKATGSMRGVQMAGPALERCQSGVFNCSFVFMDSPESMAEDLYLLMQGCGVGFSVEEEYAVDKWPRIHAKRDCTPVDYTVEDDTEAWCDAVRFGLHHWMDGVDVNFDLSPIRPAGSILKTKGGRACLTGDTVVYKDRKKDGTSNTLTISELYWRRIHRPGRLKQIQIRCLDEASGTFQRNHILDVVDNGITDVYEVVTEAGYKIKATSNHRFMNSDRNYQELKDFGVGDYIAVNGTDLSDPKWKTGKCVDCGMGISSKAERCRSCSLKAGRCDGCGFVMSIRGGLCQKCRDKSGTCVDCGTEISRRASRCKPCFDKEQCKDGALETTVRQRKECRKAAGPVCFLCERDDIRTEVHHVDGNVFNNAPENLMNLCSPCHQKLHAVERTFGNPYSHKYLSFDVIKSIQHVGKERVFDLCMEAPNHNFVANGFVSHNSGPRPLRDLLKFDRDLIFRRQKRRLRSIDILDMTCMMHRIGQMGGVRRASGLSLSDKDDLLMRYAKTGEFLEKLPWRNQTNNSTAYEEKPSSMDFMDEWMVLAKSGSGERGIFNRYGLNYQMPFRRKRGYVFGCNPCGEIILRDRGFCNLSIAVVGVDDTYEEIEKKVELATIWGTMQASMTNFRYLRPEWKRNCEEEALLGVDILGHMDCKLLKPGASGREWILQKLLKKVQETNVHWAHRFGIEPGAALTCGKPSGDSSVFFDKPAGFKPHHGRFYLRRLRFEETNPIAKVLKDAKIPWQYDYDKTGMCVFEFPCRAPDDAIIVGDMSVVEQLENWKTWKVNFTEHNPSVTVSVKEHEWIEAGNWVYQNWDIVGGISFFPYDDSIYPLTPYQAITEQEYVQRAKIMPTEIDWSRILLYEDEDETTLSAQLACTGPGCDT